MSDLIDTFFNKKFESTINDKMMYYSYKFEDSDVFDYINRLIEIPLFDYIDFIIKNYNVHYLEPSDVVQFSSLEDSTSKICQVVKNAGDKGFNALEIGKLLENDGIIRKDGAYLKYGENQAKTACQFGLLTVISNKYFLSCLGNVFNNLTDTQQEKLLRRLMLRNKLIQRLIYKAIKNGNSSYSFETSFLSESTKKRRKSNIKKIICYLCETNENDLSKLEEKIIID